MPNGVPICTGFKDISIDCRSLLFCNIPSQTVAGGSNWSLPYSLPTKFYDYVFNISGGGQHSAAIKTDGTLWLWGDGACGKLGNNSTTDRSSPVQISLQDTNWCQVSLGDFHSAGIKTDGTLWMWGGGELGKLGNNSTTNRLTPVQTVSATNCWKQVSAGLDHSAAIKTDGTLWLWGRACCGVLGNNDPIINRSSPVQTISATTDWFQVSLGVYHSAAVKNDGSLWLWGANGCTLAVADHRGVLGNNSTIDQSSPVQTSLGGTNWKQVSLGGCRARGLSAAVKTDGTLWTWGTNNFGQLGTNDEISRSTPVQTVSTTTNWKQVSAGPISISAIKTDGTLWNWGSNSCGALGTNDTIPRSSPVQTVSGGTNWKEVASFRLAPALGSGGAGSLALKTDGTLWVWGCNPDGQLGINSTVTRSSPVQTVSATNTWDGSNKTPQYCAYVSSASACGQQAAAVKTDGTLWLWGGNNFGQLGTNDTINRSSPVQTVSSGTNWKQVSLGISNSAAIKTDGTLWLWGSGQCGSLSTNDTINRSSPVQTVSQGTNWKQVSLGNVHSAAVKTDGTLWLWGSNRCGMLGNSSTINRSSPVQTVSATTDWAQVSIGCRHSAAVKTDGTLWLWGDGTSGVLGLNSAECRSSPVQTVSATANWIQVSLGYNNSAAIKADSTLWTWGAGNCGANGDGTLTNRLSPVQVSGVGWKQVSLGYRLAAAVKTDGTLWNWGYIRCGNSGDGVGTYGCRTTPGQTICGLPWTSVDVGCNFTVATTSSNNTNNLFTWGSNQFGQLGCDTTLVFRQFSDLGNQLIEKDYLIDVYPNLVPWIKAPSLWNWGLNDAGQLGISSTINQSSPVQTIAAGSNWNNISSSRCFSASVKTDGTLWLWGCGALGRLGNNSTLNRSSPVQTVSNVTGWKQVSAGSDHTVATKTDGTLWAWGGGGCGRLGNNSSINRSSPVQTVSNVTGWKQVSAGNAHSAAIKTDGTLWLWGYATLGQLGNNSTLNRSSPVQTVSTTTDWKQVSLGNSFTAAIKTDGTLWTWGCGANGRLGNDSTLNRSSPVQTSLVSTDWKQVSLTGGAGVGAAIKTDGSLWLWGSGALGRLGNNSTIDVSTPVQTVSGGNSWKKVNASSISVSAIKTDGTLWLWGCNGSGELGTNDTIDRSSPVQTIMSSQSWKDSCGSTAIYEVFDW